MTKKLMLILGIIALMIFQFEGNSQERPERSNKGKNDGKVKKVYKQPRKVSYPRNQFPRRRVVVIKPRVRIVRNLDSDHTRLVYRNRRYYYQRGRYYRYVNNNYVIAAPPFGIRIGFLPIGYRTLMVGSGSNYYYQGAYYRPIGNEFEAFEPNVGTIVPDLPEDNVEQVTIDGQELFECNDILYKAIATSNGMEYEVVGKLND